MLDDLPDELIIEICNKRTRIDLYLFSFVNKRYNLLYWESIKYNKMPFRMFIIDSLFELYLYLLKPKIDIIYMSEKHNIYDYIHKYKEKINVFKRGLF